MDEKKSFSNYIYYILIGVTSFLMLVVMPMMGSVAGLSWVFPTTFAGWTVYIISKLCSAGFNILLFHSFNKQGFVNILNNPSYLEAQNLLKMADSKSVLHPRSPSQFHHDIYGKKGLTIFITTLIGSVGLSQAILTFDVKEFILQGLALIVGIIFGVLQMKNTEDFWTTEYLEYAKEYYDNEVKNNVNKNQ